MKKYDVRLTDTVDADFGEIFDYIADQRCEPVIAEKLIGSMHEACQSLSKLPYIYPLSRDVFLAAQGFRVMPIGKYLIFYVIHDTKK